MSKVLVVAFIGQLIGNFVYQALGSADWLEAIARSYFGGAGILAFIWVDACWHWMRDE